MKPFLLGKKAHDAPALRTPPKAHAHASGPQGLVRPAPTGPHVEAVKEGDKIVRLVVTCSCGEKIEIDCLYPAGS
ncbi:hypothetical protein [Oleiharenicola sp. Vm1]|uniref:hypothetical protein n=1 Tax=Oleiharenicola sp. Vm1 TaxID=3398393 RepID=UPI0039F4DC9D